MKHRLILALAPAALALATLAQAQPAGPSRHGPPTAEIRARHEAMQKQHLDDLRIVLRLRPDQEPALAAFAEAHQPQIHEMKGPGEAKMLTTPQRLDEMAKRDAEMSAQHQRMRDALAKFYAALSPEQQKVFDALHRLKGPHGGPGGPMTMHGGPRMVMMRHGGPDGPEPGHEPPR
jgi:protein CpxP